jgi:hypothetical protein
VVFHTVLAGKAALEAGGTFLGKERVRIVHPGISKEMEGSSPRFQLRLTNLPPNATDWELLGIMNAIHAANWHIPRVPREGMTHLRCRYALVDFADSAACEEASVTPFKLRGHSLMWYHPSVATCYKCGIHGHFQATCPSRGQSGRASHLGVRRAGVSYAAAARPQSDMTTPLSSQPQVDPSHANPPRTSPHVLSAANQTNTARLDALEAQIVTLSGYFQVFLGKFDDVARAVTGIGQTVEMIARHVCVPSQVEPVEDFGTNGLQVTGAELLPSVAAIAAQALVSPNSNLPAPGIVLSSLRPTSLTSNDTPMLQVSDHEDSDQVRIAGLESSIKQLALMMESFFVHHQPTVAPPSSHSILLPGSNHSKHATVPPWRK